MVRASTRAIGRAAVREQLSARAVGQFAERGFDNVTFDDLAAEAGVSRSTYLRYFGTKEGVVLFVFDPLGEAMAAALPAQLSPGNGWRALRVAVQPAVELIARDPGRAIVLLRLVWRTPALWARLHEKQTVWRAALLRRWSEVPGVIDEPALVRGTRIMAALGCLMMALDRWVEVEGQADPGALVDATFDALALLEPDRAHANAVD